MRETLLVDCRHSRWKLPWMAALAQGWKGRYPARAEARRIVSFDGSNGEWLGEVVSRGGGYIKSRVRYGRRCFDQQDMVEAKRTVPDKVLRRHMGRRLPFSWL